jgi:hypothetical protein
LCRDKATMNIYIYLKNEDSDVWRPVEARQEGEFYRIVSVREDATEEWEFNTGDLVKCKERNFEDGTKGLVAIERV